MEPAKIEVAKSNKYLPSPRFVDIYDPIKDTSGNLIASTSPKCSHKNNGEWAVSWNEAFYHFISGNEKDAWVAAAGISNADARIKLLRWHCFECKNVQEP